MKKTLLLLAATLIVWACQDLNSIRSTDEFELTEHFGKLVDTVFYAKEARFEVNYRTDTGNGKKLCVGNYQNFESGFFIKFTGILQDSIPIDSTYIQLTSVGKYGDGVEKLSLEVYEVIQDWDENTLNTLDEYHGSLEGFTVYDTLIQLSAADSLKIQIPLDTALVNKWRFNTEENYGLYIKTGGETDNHIREFESFEASTFLSLPKLFYSVKTDSVFQRDSVFFGEDATIFDYDSSTTNVFNPEPPEDYLLLASGISARLLVRFDSLSTLLPKKAVVQVGNLEIDVNPAENTLDNENKLQAFYLRSAIQADSGLTTDSSFTTDTRYFYYMERDETIISLKDTYYQQGFGQNLLQEIVNGTKESDWFYIHFAEEATTVSVLKLFSLNDSTNNQPIRLSVRYYELTNDGF